MVMQTIISQLPPPIVTTQAIPPATHGGSGPSIHTILPTTLGGTGPSTMVPQAPPTMQVHYAPANPTTTAAPSHINLGSNLPFMALDLTQLTNDPIHHQTFWPPMPTKLPSDIPKFEGKAEECPQNHIMMFHLWCSSNSIVDDSIRLRLFQRTLTGAAAKWYIELPQAKYLNFSSLAFMFLRYFQLPIIYNEGVEIFLSCCQNTTTYITDHIHKWR